MCRIRVKVLTLKLHNLKLEPGKKDLLLAPILKAEDVHPYSIISRTTLNSFPRNKMPLPARNVTWEACDRQLWTELNEMEYRHFYNGKQTGHLICRAWKPISTFFWIITNKIQMNRRMMCLGSIPFQITCYPNIRLSWPHFDSLISQSVLSHKPADTSRS